MKMILKQLRFLLNQNLNFINVLLAETSKKIIIKKQKLEEK